MKFKRVVAVYIFNENGQVLMLKHKKIGKWLPPGGHVENDEMIHKAAIREVYEETGIKCEFIYDKIEVVDEKIQKVTVLPQPLLIQLEEKKDSVQEDFVYIAKAHDDKIENKENHEIGWFNYKQAIELEIFQNVRIHLEHIFNNMKDKIVFK